VSLVVGKHDDACGRVAMFATGLVHLTMRVAV
jgi:hypothetical protein